jgi:protein phosphatase methylesterase 1
MSVAKAFAGVALAVSLACSAWVPPRALASDSRAADGPAQLPPVVDDAGLQQAVELARERYLARQTFDRFDVTVLLEGRDGRWRRGAHAGERLAYPASCVKLAYLASAVHWCTARGRAPDCLDEHVRPMVVVSDNVATGRVVDALSGAPNIAWAPATSVPLPGGASSSPTSTAASVDVPADFADWLERRRYTERLLERHGLLAGQTLLHKTWPTNSGESPDGYERLALGVGGRNAMSPDGAARLLLALEAGVLVPEGRDYVRSLLARDRWSAHAAFGSGLPPGTRIAAKTGTAYDTVEEIAAVDLPDGRRAIVAAFSNGWNPDEPGPYDVAVLGGFVDELLRTIDGAAPPLRDLGRRRAAPWQTLVGPQAAAGWAPLAARGAYAGRALVADASDASYEWRVELPRAGRYELAVWFPAAPDRSATARYEIEGREVPVYYDQRRWGARWLPLGEVDARSRTLVVRVRNDGEGGRLVADTLRVSAVPNSTPVSSSAAARGTARTDPARPRAR